MGSARVGDVNLDLNDIKNTGIYYFDGNHVPKNIPAGVNGWLIVLFASTVEVKQIWYRFGSAPTHHEIYVRTTVNGLWGDWVKVITQREFDVGINSIWQSQGAVTGSLDDYIVGDKYKPGIYNLSNFDPFGGGKDVYGSMLLIPPYNIQVLFINAYDVFYVRYKMGQPAVWSAWKHTTMVNKD
ncbi:MAG: hypothetical protein [Bacteriophage sp.]|nr:MAG: hypothetical protein [Bacteriophage sp.]